MMSPPPRPERGLFHVRIPMGTYTAKPSDRERNWYVVDANGLTLGRLSTQIADLHEFATGAPG